MKRIIWKILIVIILIVLFITIRPIRTASVMKSIAEKEFEAIAMYDSLRKQLIGPLVVDKGNYSEYKWYKVLEWGDTAALYIDVYKRPSSLTWRDDFFWQRITMNYQWYYFEFPNGTSKFTDILPHQYANKTADFSAVKLYYKQERLTDSMKFIVNPDRLFYFLQKGHFQIVEKDDIYTIIDFYEPIANLFHKNPNDTIFTMSAKVFFNDSLEVFIMPYDVPIEIRNKK